MNKRINDFRRVLLALCFFGLIFSLIGTELPWVRISQSKPQNPIYVTNQPTCNITKVPELNGSYPTVTELQFTLDIYLNLVSSQLCQSFVSGVLPSEIGGADLKDIRMCTDAKFNQISNFMTDVSAWDKYSKSCGSMGGFTFFLIIASLLIIMATMVINTFPKLVAKCCADQNSFKNKFIRSLVAFFAPALVTLALVLYSMSCVNGDLGSVLSARNMTRSGAGGYVMCCIACALLWLYWGLFLFRMCDNEVSADGIKAKFLGKSRAESDVDAGMIDESQEQRETVHAYSNLDDGGAHNDNGTAQEQDEQRKISAYDDAGIQGPSAGAWQDVEED
eukprot:CAMPEP_0197077922 /NCGR_PEP_ID=MMETSP1384-20130603/212862_1 /TAXON_ID=29189 /ORGANISM="Ammonia sp." /LENGTH=333 /DNA_ID=CAMNT_0042516787 /DNA_START=1653 /DNA_END=2654 /DNA_ORIENTATION=-